MAPRNWQATMVRMPEALQKALRLIHFKTRISNNQVAVEAIWRGLQDFAIPDIAKGKLVPASKDPMISEFLDKARSEIWPEEGLEHPTDGGYEG